MIRTWIVLPIFLFSLSAFATPEALNKRFEFKRSEDGTLESVRMKFVTKNFSILPYIEQIKDDIKSEIKRMRSKSFYQNELEEFLAELESDRPYDKSAAENVGLIRDAIENLPNIKVDESFNAVLQKVF